MQTIINNGDSGLLVRNNLNNMFTEIYSSIIMPIKVHGLSANYNQAIVANTYVQQLSVVNVTGNPTIRIGTTPNGTDILPDTEVTTSIPVVVQQYFANASVLYITFSSGTGTLNIRLDVITNYY